MITVDCTPPTVTVSYGSEEEAEKIIMERHPRMGRYIYEVLRGERRLSGADLVGKARHYGVSYFTARKRAVDAAIEVGGHVRQDKKTRLLSLVFNFVPTEAKFSQCSVGECYVY